MRWLQALAALLVYLWIMIFAAMMVVVHTPPAHGKEIRLSRQTNAAGVDLIKKFEGCRLTAYRCAAGRCTIGFGHAADNVRMGMTISQERAEELLQQDLRHAEKAVADLVKVPISANQHAALVSFAFNLGRDNLAKSTLLKLLNARDYRGASEQFGRWIHAGSAVLPGLIRRRNAERDLFLTRS